MKTFDFLRMSVLPYLSNGLGPIGLVCFLHFGTVLHAQPQVSESVLMVTIPNYTSYVIDADTLDSSAAYDREAIQVESQVRSVNSSPASGNSSYVAQFRLLNRDGDPHPIVSELGGAGDGLSIRVTNSFSIGPSATVTRTSAAGIRPTSRLDPYDTYAVEVRIYRGVDFVTYTGVQGIDALKTYYHFTNLISNDAAYNTIAVAKTANWTRSFAVKTMPSRHGFLVTLDAEFLRYDEFERNGPALVEDIPVRLNYRLIAASGAAVALTTDSTNAIVSVRSYGPNDVRPRPVAKAFFGKDLWVEPQGQLDPVNERYLLEVTVSHQDSPVGSFTQGNIATAPGQRLLHFSGRLFFETISTEFGSIGNDPSVGSETIDGRVSSALRVNTFSGFISGNPSHRYGDSSLLPVALDESGDAHYVGSGSVYAVLQPLGTPDEAIVHGVRFVRTSPVQLNFLGASVSADVRLPAGMGWTSNTNDSILNSSIAVSVPQLDQGLAPRNAVTANANVWVFEESKPLLTWATGGITWDANQGSFTVENPGNVIFVRERYLAFLEAHGNETIDPGGMAFKRSNENYFRFVNGSDSASSFIIAADPADGSARLTARFWFGAGGFLTHFPYNTQIDWGADGILTIQDGLVLPDRSYLGVPAPVLVRVNLGCIDNDSAAGCPGISTVANLTISPDSSQLTFTRDGGLAAQGVAFLESGGSGSLRWGEFGDGGPKKYAHESYLFSRAGFHMPGTFLRGDQTELAGTSRPGVLLLSGVSTNLQAMDRPMTVEYVAGTNDYAGINFRASTGAATSARSFLGGTPTGEYSLTSRSKYYARWGGISGIHEAVPVTFPDTLSIYGYGFTFTNFGLSFLGSQAWESRTEGSTHLPYPSYFDQRFEELMLTCIGDLKKAEPPDSDGIKKLDYWKADFKTGAISFQKMPGTDCSPGGGKLVLGVKSWLSNIAEPFYGEWGFEPGGTLITYNAGLTNVDSRLQPPNNIELQGPGSEKYHFTPVSKAYLNDYSTVSNAPAPPPGWANIAGKLDVPFFEDIKIHLHTGAKASNVLDALHLMGGWPNEGWTIHGDSFFEVSPASPPFDSGNCGFPVEVTVATYRRIGTSVTGEKFAPRSTRRWAKVVDFDLPLVWSDGTRTFRTATSVTKEFVLLDIDQELKYLSPKHVELDFGVGFKNLPKINLANLAFNELGVDGVANALIEATSGKVQQAIVAGLGAMDGLLAPTGDELLEPALESLTDPVIAILYAELNGAYQAAQSPEAFKMEACAVIRNRMVSDPNSVKAKLLGKLATADGVLGQIDTKLRLLERAIGGLLDKLPEDPDDPESVGLFAVDKGKRTKALLLIQRIIGKFTSEQTAQSAREKVEGILDGAEDSIAQVERELIKRRRLLQELQQTLSDGGGIALELKDLVSTQEAVVHDITDKTASKLCSYFDSLNYAAGSPFQQLGADEIGRTMRQELRNQFYGSVLTSGVQRIVRAHFYDFDGEIRSLIDSLFSRLNDSIIDVLTEALADVNLGFTKFLGPIGEILQGSKIRGYAHIKGDSLNELRLDGNFRWSVPDELEFDAFLRIRELDAKVDYGCHLEAGETITQVDMGALKVPISWGPSKKLKADLGFGFSIKKTERGDYRPNGFTGSIDVRGGLEFEAFKIGALRAMAAVGGDQNFFAGAMDNAVFGDFDVSGGIFFGRACGPEPLIFIDPEVGEVLGSGTFTGAYAFGEGWVPIYGSSCALVISAGLGGGAFYFAEGPTYGGKMVLGISGEALCLIDVKARVSMLGSKTGSGSGGLKYVGNGTIKGKVGKCPFCKKFKKSVKITYDKKFKVKF